MLYLETTIAMFQNQNIAFTLQWPGNVTVTLENGDVQKVDLDLFYKVNDILEAFQQHINDLHNKRIETMKTKVVEVLGEDFLALLNVNSIPKPMLVNYDVVDGWINGYIPNEMLKAQVNALLAG